ncbi:hypothetical protein BST61_g6894 [Cercospora zeina]
MSFNGKRKAEDVTFNGFYADDRPTLKRRGTAAPQLHIQSRDSINHNHTSKPEEQPKCHDRNDSAMSTHNEEFPPPYHRQLPTPPLDQDEFMNEATEYPLSGPPQQQQQQQQQQRHPPSDHQQNQHQQQQRLQTLHTTLKLFLNTQNLSSSPDPHLPTSPQPQIFLTQTRTLLHHLNSHLTSLQNLAISQLQLRTQMSSLGITPPVIANLDLALQGLDAQMMDFMIGLHGIEMEVGAIEAEFSSSSESHHHHHQSPSNVTEVAMLG